MGRALKRKKDFLQIKQDKGDWRNTESRGETEFFNSSVTTKAIYVIAMPSL